MVARIRLTQLCLLVAMAAICINMANADDDHKHKPDNPANHPPALDAAADNAEDKPDEPDAPVDPEVNEGVPDVPVIDQPIVGISCYVCNSVYNGSDCSSSDPKVLKKYLQSCPEKSGEKRHERCRKTDQKVYEEERTIRQCATIGSAQANADDCYDRVGSHKITLRICECFNKNPQEPCNTATQNIITSSFVVLAASLVLAFGRYAL